MLIFFSVKQLFCYPCLNKKIRSMRKPEFKARFSTFDTLKVAPWRKILFLPLFTAAAAAGRGGAAWRTVFFLGGGGGER